MQTEKISEKEDNQQTDKQVVIKEEILKIVDEQEIDQDLILTLQNIKPDAGADILVEEFDPIIFAIQQVENVNLEQIDDIGPIDKTDTEFPAYHANIARSLSFNLLRILELPADDIAPVQGIVTRSAINPPFSTDFETSVIFSNATRGGRFIDATDFYKLDVQISKTVKLNSDILDIHGLPHDVIIHTRLKSPEKFSATLKSDWNDVKNVDVESNELTNVYLKNFVQADVSLSSDDNIILRIVDAKRGYIETGEGDDRIIIKAFTNGGGWSNTFEINSGEGDDALNLHGSEGHSIFNVDVGVGFDTVRLYGDYDFATVNLGQGNDRFNGRNGQDTVFGDGGNDRILGGDGDDILIGGEGNDNLIGGQGIDIAVFTGTIDEYIISKRGNKITIEDTVEGRDGKDLVKDVEGFVFGFGDIVDTYANKGSNVDILSIFEDFNPLQHAIDSFIIQAGNSGAPETHVARLGVEFSIIHIDHIQDQSAVLI